MFKLRGSLTGRQSLILGFVGLLILLVLWRLLAEAFAVDLNQAQIDLPPDLDAELVVGGLKLQDVDPLNNMVSENAGEGTYTGLTVAFADTAYWSNGTIFSLADDANGTFSVDPISGRVIVARAQRLDYERATSFTIIASAQNGKGKNASSNFNIKIEDRNEYQIGQIKDIDTKPNEVGRQSPSGSPTGLKAYAEDLDAGDIVLYRLVDEDRSPFSIDRRSGQVRVSDTLALQRTRTTRVYLGVEARSQDGTQSVDTFEIALFEGGGVVHDSESAEALPKKGYPILPTPKMVVESIPELWQKDELLSNTWQSIWINVRGYLWAILLSVPIGFFIGLMPFARGLFSKQVNAMRYLPLTALTGLFIVWFGIDDGMKVAFLAFGIIVYLLPVVVQRIFEVEKVYTTTVFTLGATDWQTIRTVYFPSVMSKLIDDIRVLTAISWTYIIIAELLNKQGGIGALIYTKSRQGEIPKVFAMLIVIVLIGFLQDRIFVWMDRRLFPHKYFKTIVPGLRETEAGIMVILGMLVVLLLQGWLFPGFTEWMDWVAILIIISAVVIILFGEIKIRRAVTQAK